MPGFDNTGSRRFDGEAMVQPSTERCERISRLVAQYANGDLEMVLNTSFNECHEFTPSDPGTFGRRRLGLDIPGVTYAADRATENPACAA
jgi:hypothetical protein